MKINVICTVDPPTVDNKHEIPIPTTVGHDYIYAFVRSLQIYMLLGSSPAI